MIKFNQNGEIKCEATYGGEDNGDWAGEDICLTEDGSIVVAEGITTIYLSIGIHAVKVQLQLMK